MTLDIEPKKRLPAMVLVLFVLSLITTPEVAMSQEAQNETETPAKVETNPELKDLQDEVKRLELEKQRAEALKAIAVANQAAVAAELPATEATGKEGKATIDDGAGYYAELVAYGTLGKSAASIAGAVKDQVAGQTVILTDKADLSSEAALYEVIELRVGRYQDEFERLEAQFEEDGSRKAPDAVPEGLRTESLAATALTVTSLLGAASDIAAFFKVDREIKARTVSLSKRALMAEVAGVLVGPGGGAAKVLLPELTLDGERELLSIIEAAQTTKSTKIEPRLRAVERLVAKATEDRDAAKDALAKLKKDKAPAAEIAEAGVILRQAEAALDQLTADKTRFEAAVNGFNAFVDALSTAPTGGGKTPLEAVAIVDLMRSDSGARLLYLDIPSQGAEIQVVESFWSSANISYIGGSVVVYFLLDQTGSVLVSGTIPRHGAASFKGLKGGQWLPRISTVVGGGP